MFTLLALFAFSILVFSLSNTWNIFISF